MQTMRLPPPHPHTLLRPPTIAPSLPPPPSPHRACRKSIRCSTLQPIRCLPPPRLHPLLLPHPSPPQVFNASAQSGAYHLPALLAAGYRTLRIELVDEPPEHVAPILEGYRAVAAGKLAPGKLWQLLGKLPDSNGRAGGVGGGSLDVKGERAAGSLRPTAATVKAGAAAGGRPV